MIRLAAYAAALAVSASFALPAAAQTPPSISVSISPAAADEGAKFQITFKRTGDVSQTSSVGWAVTGADAADFGGAALQGRVNFKAGQAQKGFPLLSSNDTMFEPDETFTVTLSAPTNGTIGAGQASATIRNNDASSRSPLTLVNPAQSTYWAGEDAFINHVLVGSRDYNLWVNNGWFDPATGRFVSKPANQRITLGPVRGGGVVGAGDYYKGKWVLDWQGDGDVTVTGSVGPLTRISANRIEEDYDPALHGTGAPVVRITRIGPGGISNIRFYRASHESLLASGKVFDPRWLRDVSRFDVFRPMDWTGVNGDHELKASDRPRADRPVYFDGRVPDKVLIQAAVDSGTELWLNAPGMLGVPANVAATMRDLTVPLSTRLAAAAGVFDQVMASQEPLLWARQIVAEMNAQGYPTNRRIIIELDNEVWNTNFHASTFLYQGFGQVIAQRHSGLSGTMRTGFGYRSAQYAQYFAQALAEGGRANQIWTMALPGQTVDVTRTVDALEAVIAFNGTQPMSRYGVATTNYISGGFRWQTGNLLFGNVSQATWRQMWLAELAANPTALLQRITNYHLSPTSMRANVAFYHANVVAQKAAAEAVGARWIGNFEGDSTDSLDSALAANPAAVNLYRTWHESADYGRVITAIANDVRATDPSAIMASYVFCAARRSPTTPWVECTPWDQTGGDNAAWNAILKP